MISVSGLEKAFGAQTLFSGVSFLLNPGERYGLVGANGSGKTTLLNILSGDEDPTSGTVTIPKRVQMGLLRQDQFLYEEEEILGIAMRGNPELWNAIVEKETLIAGDDPEFDAHRFSELEDTIHRHDGYAAESRAAEILEGLGLPAEVHRRPLSTLSGGFKLRVLLARALAGSPDVLLLDEPTNHLDILSIRWLEKFLRSFTGPVVVISHDHRFLDNFSTHILDVDYQTVLRYKGNYTDFLRDKQEELVRREKDITKREREIAHHQQFVDRFRAKASKARQAQSKLRLIEKRAEGLQALPQSSRRYPGFRFEIRRPSGQEVLKIRGVKKSFGENEVLLGVDLTIDRGDRLAIMGPNGIGKSTLLKIVMGELAPDAGSVEWGYETHPSYFAQDHKEQFESPQQAADDWIAGACPGRTVGFVRGELGRVLFSGDDAKKKLGSLSGGEAARLVFCRIAIERPNVLVLDEPTNHLDLESIEALVESLQSYEGTLLLVSHDRWFVSQLATRIVEITAEGVNDYRGTYSDYVHQCGDDHLDVDAVILRAKKEKQAIRVATEDGPAKSPKKDVAQSKWKGQRLTGRSDEITAQIEQSEARVSEIDEIFCEPAFYNSTPADAVWKLESERAKLQGELADLVREWEEIEEALDALD
ncbi:MAG: ABC-F family ATP-binding cassette domain-containing protein [Gemmatimonadota bacterium]